MSLTISKWLLKSETPRTSSKNRVTKIWKTRYDKARGSTVRWVGIPRMESRGKREEEMNKRIKEKFPKLSIRLREFIKCFKRWLEIPTQACSYEI